MNQRIVADWNWTDVSGLTKVWQAAYTADN